MNSAVCKQVHSAYNSRNLSHMQTFCICKRKARSSLLVLGPRPSTPVARLFVTSHPFPEGFGSLCLGFRLILQMNIWRWACLSCNPKLSDVGGRFSLVYCFQQNSRCFTLSKVAPDLGVAAYGQQANISQLLCRPAEREMLFPSWAIAALCSSFFSNVFHAFFIPML